MVTTSTQWWEIGLFTTVDEGIAAARSDDALRQRAVRHEHAATRLSDHRQRILLDAQRDSGSLEGNGAPAQPRLPRPAEGRSAVFHRSGGLRRADHADRRAARSHHRRTSTVEGLDRQGTRTGSRTRPPTTSYSTTSTRPTTPSTTRRPPPGWARSTDPMAVLDPQLRVKGVSRLRVVDASAMPKLPAVNPNITVMTMAEKCADLIRRG